MKLTVVKNIIATLTVLGSVFTASSSFAYYSVLNTGEILPEGKYTLTGETQFITDPNGMNVAARFDSGLDEATGFRGLFGVGKTDIFAGALFKYIPYPDIEGQPAVGFNAGVLYGSDEGYSEFTLRFEPLVSKKFSTSFGYLIPYGSLPLGLQHRTKGRDKNDLAIQLVGGTEIAVDRLQGLRFMAEGGVDIDHAYNYISLAAIFDFDESGFSITTGE